MNPQNNKSDTQSDITNAVVAWDFSFGHLNSAKIVIEFPERKLYNDFRKNQFNYILNNKHEPTFCRSNRRFYEFSDDVHAAFKRHGKHT